MRQFKNVLAKVMFAVFVLFMAYPNTMVVRAEVVEAELITLEETQDFTVMFTYEGERPEITFLSPSGVEYAEGITPETVLMSAHGEGWSTYKVIAAEAGTWSVRCDKKNNEYVDYSFVEAVDGLSIQNFDLVSIEGNKATVSFLVNMGEDEQIWYNYTITAIAGEDQSAGKVLEKGGYYTGQNCEQNITLDLTSYSDYRLLLEVTASQGLEMFDSMMSEPFSYENSATPVAMEDYTVLVNTSNNSCQLDWRNYSKGWNSEYTLLVIADGDTENPVYLNQTTETQDSFFYPEGTKKVTIQLYYNTGGAQSEPCTKELDLTAGETLEIMTEDVTAGTQLELSYRVNAPTLLEVWINEESGQYNIEGTSSVFLPLNIGVNTVDARFAGSNNVTYQVSAQIYRDATPPVLLLYENLDGMTFKNAEAVISGEVQNAVKVTVNDVEVELGENGVFRHTLALTEGENNVTIVATSEAGIGIARNMQIIRKGGGIIAGGSYKEYLPLLISLGVSVLIILYTLIFVRKKDKSKKKPLTYKRVAVKFGLWVFVLDAICGAGYAYFYRFNTGREYIALAKESVSKAARYKDYEWYCLMGVVILTGVLVLNLLLGLLVRTLRKKRAQKKLSKATTEVTAETTEATVENATETSKEASTEQK